METAMRPRRRVITDLAADMAAVAERNRLKQEALKATVETKGVWSPTIETSGHYLRQLNIRHYPRSPATSREQLIRSAMQCYNISRAEMIAYLATPKRCNHYGAEVHECLCPMWCECRQRGNCIYTPSSEWKLKSPKTGQEAKMFEVLTPRTEWSMFHGYHHKVMAVVRAEVGDDGLPIHSFIVPHDSNGFRLVFDKPTVGCAFVTVTNDDVAMQWLRNLQKKK